MDSKKIYLIRHGQTDYNKSGVVQGSGINASLNATGYKQAQLFFEAYRHIPFDKIYTSALRRTIQSVQQFIDMGIPHEALPGLNEISWGIAEGTALTSESHAYYLRLTEQWKKGELHLKIDGGESPLDVQNRQEEAIKHILSHTEEKTILVCMHGRAMRILLSWLQDQPLTKMDDFAHDNLCLYKLHYQSGAFRIEAFNDVSHLVDIK